MFPLTLRSKWGWLNELDEKVFFSFISFGLDFGAQVYIFRAFLRFYQSFILDLMGGNRFGMF